MEPVLTQEELEAIYAAMKGDDLPSVSVDDVALTAGQEFISRAEARWNEAVKEMSPRIGSVLTGALGKRVNVTSHMSQAVVEDENRGLGGTAMPLKDGTSVLAAAEIGGIQVLFGIDLEIARRVVERLTGAKSTDASNATEKKLTALENRLIRDLISNLVQAATTAVPYECKGELITIEVDDVWAHRVKGELWLTTGVGLTDFGSRGVRIAAPVRLFVPKAKDMRQALSRRLTSAEIVLTAELGKFEITVQQLWRMKIGTLIPIDTTVGDPLRISIGGIPKMLGTPLVSRGNISVEILGHIDNGVGK